jgi:hypothetical protein
MGTPVKIRVREEQCRGAGPCTDPRPLTEAELLKYYTKEDIERMKAGNEKIQPPEKEKLIEVLAEVQGKTKAVRHAAKRFYVSTATVCKWVKEYGIEFDVEGKVIENKAPEHEDEDKPTITITGQETKEVLVKIGYVEYDVGKHLIQVDYRAEIVAINGLELPFDEADTIADLLVNIL